MLIVDFINDSKLNSASETTEVQTLRQLVRVLQERLKHEQEELENSKRNAFCLKCKVEPRDTVTVPCMHLLCCYKCVIELSTCFACDREVEGLLRCNISE